MHGRQYITGLWTLGRATLATGTWCSSPRDRRSVVPVLAVTGAKSHVLDEVPSAPGGLCLAIYAMDRICRESRLEV